MSIRSILALGLGVSVLAICAHAPAWAEDASPAAASDNGTEQAHSLNTILVTGEKVERTIQETTSSVAVITNERIEDSTMSDLRDVFSQTANINERFGGEGFVIRGINNASVTGGGSGALATLYIDNAPINHYGTRVGQHDVWDLSQVEVFRGPQSTTQGRNALAGAVIVRTADPTYETEAKARAILGTFGTKAVSAAFGGSVIEDQLAVRFAFDRQATDGFIENPTLGLNDYGRETSTLARTKFLIEPSGIPELDLLLTTSFSRNHSGDDVVAQANPFANQVFSNIVGFENVDQYIASLEANYQLSEVFSLSSVTTFNKTIYNRRDDDDQSAAGGNLQRNRENTGYTYSQELRLHFEGNDLRGHFGAYYLDEFVDDLAIFDSAQAPTALGVPGALAGFYPNPFLLTSISDVEEDTLNLAVFGETEYDLTDQLTLFAGLRFDYEEQERRGWRRIDPISALPTGAGLPAPVAGGIAAVNTVLLSQAAHRDLGSQNDYKAFLPKVGATFDWTEDLSTSFTVQRGYRAGGSGTDFITGDFTYDPEYTWNYELALRSTWLNDSLTFNANLFYTDWTDMQVQLRNPGNLTEFIVTNAGSAELYGGEIELAAYPIPGMELGSSLGYVHTEFTEFNSPSGNFAGNRFAEAPEWTLSAYGTHRFDNGLFAHLNANYQSSSFTEVSNNQKNDERILVNTKVGYEQDTFGVYLFSRNLLDEEYITLNRIRNAVVKIGEPRTIGVEASIYW